MRSVMPATSPAVFSWASEVASTVFLGKNWMPVFAGMTLSLFIAFYPTVTLAVSPLISQPIVSPLSSPKTAAAFREWLIQNGYAAPSPRPVPRPPQPKMTQYERDLAAMRSAVPPNSPQAGEESDLAFRGLLQKNLPLTPQQVVELHQQIDMSQRAASIPATVPPKPVSTTLMINLAPGGTPPAIRLAQGYVTSLVFVDSTGAPWPIAAFDIGDPKAMGIQWDGKSNLMFLQAVQPYSDGDIVIRLVGLATPITLELVSGQRVVDYRVDIHVAGIGPNTKELPLGSDLPNSANQLLLGVLDGVAPAGSKQLTVEGADADAWALGDKMYLRTHLTVLSPGWMGKMTSADGTLAYELPKTSTVLVSRYGEPVELKIEGF